MDDKLTTKEKFELAVQSGLQLVPYVGGALSTAYFGLKQEKRIKRIETFYNELAIKVEATTDNPLPVEAYDTEKLLGIIEEVNEKVEKEYLNEKIEFLQNYMINLLISPIHDIHDDARFFLDTLSKMTLLECSILIKIYQNKKNIVAENLISLGTDRYQVLGAINRLKIYGFLAVWGSVLRVGGPNPFEEELAITTFGTRFVEFCLKEV